MDLGLTGKRALVCASSKGLGKACAMALAREGVDVTLTGRSAASLQAVRDEIHATAPHARIGAVAADLNTEAGRTAILAACPAPDILVTNNGGPPPGDFRQWSREDWIAALDMNMLVPIAMIRATIDGMVERRWGRIVNITSSAVKAPIAELGLSNGARSGLTGFIAGLSRRSVKSNVTINNLLPGAMWTDRLRSNVEFNAQKQAKPVEEVKRAREAAIPAGRFGTAEEFGDYCAYLCSAQASYITGQNLLIDGGNYPGTF